MRRILFIGAALALGLGSAAQAQSNGAPADAAGAPSAVSPPAAGAPSAVSPPAAGAPSAVNPPAPAAPGDTAGLKAGMVVKDTTGATVGTIAQIGKTADGSAAVTVKVDGKEIGVLASALTPSGSQAISTQTKAQLLASNPPARQPG